MAANDLVNMVEQGMERNPNPNNKIIKNLATFLCVDSSHTPNICEVSSFFIRKKYTLLLLQSYYFILLDMKI